MLGISKIYYLNFSSFSMFSFYNTFIICFKMIAFPKVKSHYKSGNIKGDRILKQPHKYRVRKIRGLFNL